MRAHLARGLVCLAAAALVLPTGAAADDEGGDAVPSRIGGFLREAVEYIKRSDRVEVGDVAPNFELVPLRFYDFDLGMPDEARNARAEGYRGVELAAFRGKRPVALVFGSYT